MAQASATKVGDLAPPLELPDTSGTVHALPTRDEAPATVVGVDMQSLPVRAGLARSNRSGGARLRGSRRSLSRRELERPATVPA
jgi:hypothetical protein